MLGIEPELKKQELDNRRRQQQQRKKGTTQNEKNEKMLVSDAYCTVGRWCKKISEDLWATSGRPDPQLKSWLGLI